MSSAWKITLAYNFQWHFRLVWITKTCRILWKNKVETKQVLKTNRAHWLHKCCSLIARSRKVSKIVILKTIRKFTAKKTTWSFNNPQPHLNTPEIHENLCVLIFLAFFQKLFLFHSGCFWDNFCNRQFLDFFSKWLCKRKKCMNMSYNE